MEYVGHFQQTILFQKGLQLLWFNFGKSDTDKIPIGYQIKHRMWPSLSLTIPNFILALITGVTFSMIVAFYRGTYIDITATILCVIGMSISSLFYIILGQIFFSEWLKIFPVSGYDPSFFELWRFVAMPIIIGIIMGLGGRIRFYRTLFLEEIGRDYIRTARAKGLSETKVLFKHGLKNTMIPILTSVVMTIPFLFMGSFLFETFFSIPGLGAFAIEAILGNDFSIVRSMVYISSLLYMIGLILTDISYVMVDPRIRFT
jgi:peptide/nickel transport system permease protein